MVAFGHTAVGVIVGATVASHLTGISPVESLAITTGAGLLSHYIADLIPHGHFFKENEYKKKIIGVLIFDLFFSLVLFTFLSFLKYGITLNFLHILFGIGASQFPDVLDGLMYIGILPKKGPLKIEYAIHRAVHWHGTGKTTRQIGISDVWQLAVVLYAFYLLYKI